MENNTVPNPEAPDYLALAQELAAERKSTTVHVNGKELLVKEPDSMRLLQFFKENIPEEGFDQTNELEAMSATIGIVKLCLPEGLTDDQVFSIMMKAGYLEEESELRSVVEGYINTTDFFNAGNSEDADADFSQPEASTSASATG